MKEPAESALGADVARSSGVTDEHRLLAARFEELINISADAVVSVDESQKIILFNKGAETIFGYTAAEVLGQRLEFLIPERFRAAHEQHVRNFGDDPISARKMGDRREIYGRRKGGAQFPAEASISKISVGGALVYTAVLRDVSVRKRIEQDRIRLLQEAQEARVEAESANDRMSFLADLSADLEGSLDYVESLGVLADRVVGRLADFCVIDVIDEDGSVRRVHAAARDEEDQHTISALGAFRPDPSRPFLLRETLRTGQPRLIPEFDDEFIAGVAQDAEHAGLLRALNAGSCMCVPLSARGSRLGALALFSRRGQRPFSEGDLHFLEQVCRRAAVSVDNTRLYRQAQRAIGLRDQVLGVVSHDLRNPLAVMSMVGSTLASEKPMTEEGVHELGATIQEATAWMNRLIGDLLDIASIEAGKLSVQRKPTDPVVLVMRAAAVFEQQVALKSLELLTELPEHLPAVNADPQRALQVLSNLIGNAVKFTDSGGTVRISAALAESGREVQFAVADSGRGIDAADIDRIFDRYWHKQGASRVRGTGLGLAIAKGIVDAHSGKIWVESVPDGGSTFHFTIPLV